MGAYGTYPTRYGNLSDEDLYSMYRGAVYGGLKDDEKLDLLQETVNRDAAERGELGAPLVQYDTLPSDESARAVDGNIYVDYDKTAKGLQSANYNGTTTQREMDDYNVQALNSVLHENEHCWQNQVIDGTIEIDDQQLTNEYRANNFTVSAVLQDGNYRLGSQYMTGENPGGYYMYYFQSTERDAFLTAEQKTDSLLHGIISKYGNEKSFEAYAKDVEANGYQATEQRAARLFQNPNFEKDLNQALQNQYYGTEVPVDPNTERAVKSEMVASYQAELKKAAEENNLMNEKEDIDMKNTGMNQEEAIKSVGDAAENHLGEEGMTGSATSGESIEGGTLTDDDAVTEGDMNVDDEDCEDGLGF